jgi:hypothetical protein
MKKDILQVLKDLLKHRTEDAGCYEFVLEAWIEEAAAEIERLRLELSVQKACTVAGREEIARLREAIRRLADQDATLSVQDGSVTVTMDATLTDAICPHVRGTVTQHCSLNFTLTDEEREAIEVAAAAYAGDHGERFAATLRSLLERLK